MCDNTCGGQDTAAARFIPFTSRFSDNREDAKVAKTATKENNPRVSALHLRGCPSRLCVFAVAFAPYGSANATYASPACRLGPGGCGLTASLPPPVAAITTYCLPFASY